MKWNRKWYTKLNIAEGRKPHHGVNGILTNYNIQFDPYLGLGISAIIIPCDFIECRNAMDIPFDSYLVPKDHQKYSLVTRFKYYHILG